MISSSLILPAQARSRDNQSDDAEREDSKWRPGPFSASVTTSRATCIRSGPGTSLISRSHIRQIVSWCSRHRVELRVFRERSINLPKTKRRHRCRYQQTYRYALNFRNAMRHFLIYSSLAGFCCLLATASNNGLCSKLFLCNGARQARAEGYPKGDSKKWRTQRTEHLNARDSSIAIIRCVCGRPK